MGGIGVYRTFLRLRGERPKCQTAACPGRGGGAGWCPGGAYLEGTLGTPPGAGPLLEVKTEEDAPQ